VEPSIDRSLRQDLVYERAPRDCLSCHPRRARAKVAVSGNSGWWQSCCRTRTVGGSPWRPRRAPAAGDDRHLDPVHAGKAGGRPAAATPPRVTGDAGASDRTVPRGAAGGTWDTPDRTGSPAARGAGLGSRHLRARCPRDCPRPEGRAVTGWPGRRRRCRHPTRHGPHPGYRGLRTTPQARRFRQCRRASVDLRCRDA
jgi:hypothetical protein